jgi:hypothetical protein
MNNKKLHILTASIWDEVQGRFNEICNIDNVYDLTLKDDVKRLTIDSLNYLVKGYKIALVLVNSDFISLISNNETLCVGYTNKEGEHHEFNISNIVFPSNEYGNGYFDAYCIDEDGKPEGLERTFKIERVDFIKASN